MLYIIGIGLHDIKDISEKAVDAMKQCSIIFLESYTSKSLVTPQEIQSICGKIPVIADRALVEHSDQILKTAQETKVAFLVIGDALSATTHAELLMEARKRGIETEIIHNASILSSVAVTGLSLYKFGKTASIPFAEQGFEPESFFDILEQNMSIKAHTLFLLDLRPEQNRFMTAAEAVDVLLTIADKRKSRIFSSKTSCIACSSIGSPHPVITYASAEKLKNHDLGPVPHCLIVPSALHFKEDEMLAFYRV